MKPLLLEQLKELNSIYCIVLLGSFTKINFKKMALANFVLKYPAILKKLDPDTQLMEFEKEGLPIKEKFQFQDSWDKLTFDSLKILVSKNLVSFDNTQDKLIIKSELTDSCLKKIAKFEEFDILLERAQLIKNAFNKKTEEEIIRLVNG